MRHTGRTDVPLTEAGREEARSLAPRLAGREFSRVLMSPLSRAVETCELAGLAAQAERREELLELDYGEYEGLTRTRVKSRSARREAKERTSARPASVSGTSVRPVWRIVRLHSVSPWRARTISGAVIGAYTDPSWQWPHRPSSSTTSARARATCATFSEARAPTSRR